MSRMEDVLDLYAEPFDPAQPVVTFDERPVQLIRETRPPVAAQPGQREHYDYEYHREGRRICSSSFNPGRGGAMSK